MVTPRPLVRENWRERWAHVRDAWLRWDPLGGGSTDDRYDHYVGPTLSLLARHGPLEDLELFFAEIELDQMGRPDSDAVAARRKQAAAELYDWFANLPRP